MTRRDIAKRTFPFRHPTLTDSMYLHSSQPGTAAGNALCSRGCILASSAPTMPRFSPDAAPTRCRVGADIKFLNGLPCASCGWLSVPVGTDFSMNRPQCKISLSRPDKSYTIGDDSVPTQPRRKITNRDQTKKLEIVALSLPCRPRLN